MRSVKQLHAESRLQAARGEAEHAPQFKFVRPDQPNQEPGRVARPVDSRTNVTFVIYPKPDSSRIVEIQGKEPNMGLRPLVIRIDRFIERQ